MTDDRSGALWGGRFGSTPDPAIHRFTNSLPFDRRLVRHDLIGSLAHARMLWEAALLTDRDAEAILDGLSALLREVEGGELSVEGPEEDVHTWIERKLGERVGAAAGRLHTARSRNDQTSVALRLYAREAIRAVVDRGTRLQSVWMEEAAVHLETYMPGYTHLQRGQPVSLAHHLLAHFWALDADLRRLRGAHDEAGASPLGAGALAGTSLPIEPERTAALLGLERIIPNSILAVADRGYVLDAAFGAAALMVDLSRWADEVVLWASSEFGFARLADEVSQGSSLMPQKRNPEAAELIRGKTSRCVGRVTALLTLLKGLPFAYNSDLQEDKEALFDALDTVSESLEAAAVVAAGIEYRPEAMQAALRGGMVTATELADYLTSRGVPFREAHEQAGHAVREAERRGMDLWELPFESLRACCPDVRKDVFEALDPERAAAAHASPGGPAPKRVREQLARAHESHARLREWLESVATPPIYRAHRDGTLLAERLP